MGKKTGERGYWNAWRECAKQSQIPAWENSEDTGLWGEGIRKSLRRENLQSCGMCEGLLVWLWPPSVVSSHCSRGLGLSHYSPLLVLEMLCVSSCFSTCLEIFLLPGLLLSSESTLPHVSQLTPSVTFSAIKCSTLNSLKLGIDLWSYFITGHIPPKLKALMMAESMLIFFVMVFSEYNFRTEIQYVLNK